MKLKTLKDLEGDMGDALYFFRGKEEPTNNWEGKIVFSEELKQEAIKWVKFNKPKLYGKPIIKPKFSAKQVNEIVRNVFKHFFNITEEDLNHTQEIERRNK